jgi:hypothetical protein
MAVPSSYIIAGDERKERAAKENRCEYHTGERRRR